jgi:hypothetical protein
VGLDCSIEVEPGAKPGTHQREKRQQRQDETPAAEEHFFERGNHGFPLSLLQPDLDQ